MECVKCGKEATTAVQVREGTPPPAEIMHKANDTSSLHVYRFCKEHTEEFKEWMKS